MARSYKKLAEIGRRRIENLQKMDIESDAFEKFQNNLDVFYSKYPNLKRTKSGISFTKKMTADQRKEMAQITRAFLNEPLTTPSSIDREFKKKFKDYIKDDSVRNPQIDNDDFNNLSYKDKVKLIDRIDRILQDRKFKESLGSEVLYILYYNHQQPLDMNPETLRQAMVQYVENENIENSSIDSDYVVNSILSIYDDLINESGE